jgi:hypothetical protein
MSSATRFQSRSHTSADSFAHYGFENVRLCLKAGCTPVRALPRGLTYSRPATVASGCPRTGEVLSSRPSHLAVVQPLNHKLVLMFSEQEILRRVQLFSKTQIEITSRWDETNP